MGGDAQVIGFKPPLTLILGSNGSGKTTIIEALRMACTGALPPNANRGASFVHDPKLSRATETKGKIMLRFLTSQGETLTVTRSFQLTNKKGDKQTFQQLEGNIKVRPPPHRMSPSKRCLDMDNIVPSLMGVSKAVLENVIFCHQEESNWVLGEPKILKDKFDNIFASSRYSKAPPFPYLSLSSHTAGYEGIFVPNRATFPLPYP
ncbi:AAA domain-containing protein [Baffinella frigidus]|nr:AAA domain-containing protein [Cryptophyta sp. CCMP2293]